MRALRRAHVERKGKRVVVPPSTTSVWPVMRRASVGGQEQRGARDVLGLRHALHHVGRRARGSRRSPTPPRCAACAPRPAPPRSRARRGATTPRPSCARARAGPPWPRRTRRGRGARTCPLTEATATIEPPAPAPRSARRRRARDIPVLLQVDALKSRSQVASSSSSSGAQLGAAHDVHERVEPAERSGAAPSRSRARPAPRP